MQGSFECDSNREGERERERELVVCVFLRLTQCVSGWVCYEYHTKIADYTNLLSLHSYRRALKDDPFSCES